MRRTTAVSALTLSILGLGVTPALADDPPPEGPPEGVWSPVAEDFYSPLPFEACGRPLVIQGGDVLDAEERVSELEDGTVLIEFRGSATVDILDDEGRVLIDELDISGIGSTLISADGSEFINILYGASVGFPFSDVEREAFLEAFGTDLAYWADPEESVIFSAVVDPETGEVTEVIDITVDAEIVDLCESLDDDHGDKDDKDDDDDKDDGHHDHDDDHDHD